MAEAVEELVDLVHKANSDDLDSWVPAVDMEARTVSGYISTPDVDRDGEVVPVDAFKRHIGVYKSNPILILSHIHKSMPVGRAVDIQFREDGLWAKFKLANTKEGQDTLQLFADGCLRGFSTGFIPLEFIENPPRHMIPSKSLHTANGRKIKKLYKTVELVEVSALAIPSNRRALVDRAEKGNAVAGLVVKMFDAADEGGPDLVEMVVKEWVEEQEKAKGFLSFATAEPVADFRSFITAKGAALMYALRNLGSDSVDYSSSSEHQPVDRLAEISSQQQQIISELQQINDKDSWTAWAKKWGIRLGVGAGTYLLLTRTQAGRNLREALKRRAQDWARERWLRRADGGGNVSPYFLGKGYDSKSAAALAKAVTDSLDLLQLGLDRAKQVGADDTPEFKKLQDVLQPLTDEMLDLSETQAQKAFWEVISKGLTEEQFEKNVQEGDIKRGKDGKFSKAAGGGNVHSAREDAVSPSAMVSKLASWARGHKGAIFSVAVAVPLTFVTVKVGGRVLHAVYSESSKRFVRFDTLSRREKLLFYNEVKPGDVILTGAVPYKNISDVGKDVGAFARGLKKILQDKPVTEAGAGRLAELMAKVGSRGQYTHSGLVVGKFDERALKKMLSSPKSDKILNDLIEDIFLGGQPKIGIKPNALNRIKWDKKPRIRTRAELDRFLKAGGSYSDLDLSHYYGFPLTARLTKEGILSPGMFVNPVVIGGRSAGGGGAAILRPKHPATLREQVGRGAFEDILKRDRVGFKQRNVSQTGGRVASRSGILDPVSGRFVSAFMDKEHLVCSGAVSEMYRKYGNRPIAKDPTIISPMDLARNKKFADMVIRFHKDQGLIRESAEGFSKAETPPPLGEAVAAVTATGGAAAGIGSYMSEETKKGFLSFISKGLTEEQFDQNVREGDIKRGPDGKFVSSGGGAKAVSKPKGQHGGKRPGAGRLPKSAPAAVEIQREKFRKKHPKASDAEIDKMVRADAVRRGKPDWIEYMDNPTEYMKKEEARLRSAAAARYNNSKRWRSHRVPSSSQDIAGIRNSLQESKRAFDEERVKLHTLKDAWATFRDKEADKLDRNHAGLILAAGGFATALGLAAVLHGRPSFRRVGIELAGEPFRVVGRGPTRAAARHLGASGEPTLSKIYNPTWIEFRKVTKSRTKNPDEIFIQETNALTRFIGNAVKRWRGETGQWAMTGGAKWEGLLGRFHPGKRYNVRMDANDVWEAYIPRTGDMDMETGIRFVGENGRISWEDLFRIAEKRGKKISLQKISVGGKKKRREISAPFRRYKTPEGYVFERVSGVSDDDLQMWLLKNRFAVVDRHGKLKPTREILPEWINRSYITNAEKERLRDLGIEDVETLEDFRAKAEKYRGWREFMNAKVIGPFSRKFFAGISVAAGGAGAASYYFHKDVFGFAQAVKEEDERLSGKPSKKEISAELALERERTKQKKEESKKVRHEIELSRRRREEAAQKEIARMHTNEALARDRALGLRRPPGITQKDVLDFFDKALKETGSPLAAYNMTVDWLAAISEAAEDVGRKSASKGVDPLDLVLKELTTDGPKDLGGEISIQDLTTAMAEEAIDQFVGMSDSTKIVIDGALPGHTQYEELNDLLSEMYVAMKKKYQLPSAEGSEQKEEKAPDFLSFVLKGLTEEQFEKNVREGDIRRGRGGKFSKAAGAIKGAAAGLVVGLGRMLPRRFGGKFIFASGSNVVRHIKEAVLSRRKEMAAAEEAGRYLLSRVKGGKIGKAGEHIMNLRVTGRLSREEMEGLAPEVRELVEYIQKPTRYQADLMSVFGHLDAIPGAKEINIVRKMKLPPKSLDEYLDNMTTYDSIRKKININLDEVERLIKSGFVNLTPDRMIQHEFAHSITMEFSEGAKLVMDRNRPKWKAALDKLVGKRYRAKSVDAAGNVIEEEGEILSVATGQMRGKEYVESAMASIESSGWKMSAETVKDFEERAQKGMVHDIAFMRVRQGDKELDVPLAVVGICQNQATMTGLFSPRDAFVVSGIDSRELYGLQNLSEFISVQAEKGRSVL